MIPYGRQWIDDDDIRAVTDVLKSDYLTTGPIVKQFEDAVSTYVKSKYAVSFSSGTAALHAATSIAINKGDEAITTPITFLSTPNSILFNGGKVKFTDINPDTFVIDETKIRKRITRKTKAILPVDLGGHPCNLDIIKEIANDHDLIVIEDACHAIGSEYKNKKIGSISDMTTFSFHPVKHITTGEGGMVTTNNEEYYNKLIAFRNHGIVRPKNKPYWYYEMQSLGYNYRLTDIQSALGLSQLKKLDKFIKRRREIIRTYKKTFMGIIQHENIMSKSSYHLCIARIKNRDKVFKGLRNRGIGVQLHYIPIYRQPYYMNDYNPKDYPECEKYYKEAISLPLYPKLTNEELYHTIDILKELGVE